jgi:beta-glucanase (GH16 family)
VRAKMPTGIGTWPAIWMLGKNINEPGAFWTSTYGTVNWPACGEIDIMEHWGNNQNFVQSAMHTPSSFGNTINKGGQTISTVSSQFHIYTLEWTSERMIFSVDNVVHYIYNPIVKNANTWPFDAEQYLLLNIAIEPTISASFSQSSMEVDYVRVYQENVLSTSDDVKLNDIIVYPNPVSDNLIIQTTNNLLGIHAKIYSILGQEIGSIFLNEQENNIDVSHLKKGIYIVKIETENGIKTFKIIKN